MKGCVIVRYSEIGLKGNNKSDFEMKLIRNIRAQLKNEEIKPDSIRRLFSRIIIFTEKKPYLKNVFGISSFSYANIIPPTIDGIKDNISTLIKDYTKDTTFRISVKRLDKDFHLDSMGVEREIGAFVVEKTGAKVNLKNFEKEIGVELLKDEFIIFDEKIRGAGGLPVGIEGKALVMIDDENSIKAAILSMKRGCEIFPIGFSEKNIDELRKYSPNKLVFQKVKNFKDIDEIGKTIDAKALVVGQTFENFKELETNLLVLRPVVALTW